MGTFHPSSFFSNVISKAMLLLGFALVSTNVFAQITQLGTATSATSTTESVTVNKPSGLTVGNVMIATINQADNDNNSLANATSTGWTLVAGEKYYETGNNEWWGTVLYKVADATDVAAANFLFTGDVDANDMQASIVAFSGVDPSNPIDVAGTFTSSATDNASLSANAVTTTTSNAAVIMLAMISDNRNFNGDWNTTSPSSLTERFDNPFDADLDMGIAGAWAIKPSAGSTGNGNVTLSGNARDGAILIALRAAIPGSTLTTVFTSNGTFTVPNCISSITVEAWGGGGGGFNGDNSGGGKGGGGGGYAKGTINNVSGSYNVTVGTGGAENTNGTASTFGSTLVVADFGRGGTSSTNGGGAGGTVNTGNVTTSNGGAGGNGNNTDDVGGGGGGAGGPNGAGANGANGASNVGGNGGNGNSGLGGNGGSGGNGGNGVNGSSNALGGGGGGGGDNGSNGGNAGFPGGGGGGGENGGGLGGNGLVIVTYILPNNPTITLTNTTANSCFSASAQNVTLAYSTTTGCPNLYSIDFASGITDVIDANLSGSPITIALPANLAAGTYTGTLTVKNSTYGFVSSDYSITITVTAVNTAGTASSTPTLCINTALTNITRTTTGATGIGTPTGLPAGVTPTWASNVLTISGTPTASGTFNYSIPLTGGCGSVNATGTITVTPNNTITLSSAAGTNAQTGCVNTAITNITYATTTATGATVSGLPTGVSGSWSSNVFTITGTPSVTGTFNYTVTMTGGCTGGTNTATGSITVQDGSIGYANLQFPATQSVCIGNNFTAYGRVYALGVTEAAGANAIITAQIGYNSSNTNPSTWPAGNWSAATYNVQSGNNDEYQATLGSSLTAGTYYYTFRFSRNGCAWVYGGYSSGGGGFWNGTTNVNGVLTVNANNTIALTSAAGTNAQTRCVNTAITNITYATTNATGATVSGLPTGVSGSWSSNVFTITGTPSVAGTFNYTVTMTGGCTGGTNTATGSITVQDGSIGYANLQFPATQSVCIGNNFTAYGRVYALGVTEAVGANAIITAQIGYNSSNTNPSTWPAGNWSAATYSVQSGNNDEYQATLGSSLTAGTYYYTFRFSRNGCAWVYGGYSLGGGGFWNGTTNVNGVFTINPNLIAPTAGNNSRCGAGSVTISAVAGAGETIDWYAAATGGSPLSGGTGTSSFNTPSISTNTTYYAAARNTTTGCSSATRTAVVATVNPVPTSVTASVLPTAICAGTTVALNASATSNSATPYTMLTENFNAANPAWTTVNNSAGGTPANAAWTIRANNYNNGNNGAETIVTSDASSFMFSDSDDQGNGSSTNASLISPAFSTTGVAAANINLNHYFRFNDTPDQAFVEASVDGSTWLTLQSYTSTQGSRNAFANAAIPLTAAYLNQPVVYIRLRYVADWGWYWAVNSVTVTSSSTAAAFSWTSTPAGFTSGLEDPTGVTPSVSSTYTVTATNNFGCSTSATTASVTVTPAPAAPTSAGNSRCGAGTVALAASVAGGNTVDWFANPTGGAPLPSGTGTLNFTTPNISATTIYYAEARNIASGCRSTTRTAVTATINQTPAITSPFTGKGCDGVVFTASPTNVDDGVVPAGTTYTWSAPTGSGFTGGSAQSTPQASISQTLTLTGASAAVASYTVTPRVGTCIGATFTAEITINPNPTVAITADYCSVGGQAVLSATAGLSSYTWSTGSTGASLNVQQAGSYSVTGFSAQGCSATATIGVATELVTNGNFNAGNTGFTTGYTFVADGLGNNELVPEGTYSVASNANNLHYAFFGTGYGGSGNFMIINGSPTITAIWSQNNVAVQPNTTYYFSAWGLTLVDGNNAALQFSINGSQVGSIANLPNGATSGPNYPWARFYGQWNSGNNTSVNLEIINLQLALGGNDFGIDNISFGTFAPIGLTVTPGANSNSAVCQGSQFLLNANPDGGASPYSYAWTGPNGFTSTLENPSVTNNATSAINGTYNVAITDGLGCVRNGSTTVAVSALPTALTPSAQSATVCAGVATNITIPTTQEDVGYTLYDSATNQPVSGTFPGNLGTLSLSTGALNSTTTFYVVAQRYATGCSRTLTPNVTVTVATTPVLVTNNIALCTGTANLTAAAVTAGSTGGGTLSYWTNATATTAVANAASVTAGTYYIKAVVGSCEDIEPVNVIISGTPVSTFNYTGSPFCSNGTNPIPAYSGSGSAGAYTATPAGLAFVSASTGVINLAASAAGTYTVTNTITPVGACTPSSTSRTIIVTAAPDPTFGYASNGFCQAVGANNPVPVFDNGAQAGTFTTSALSGLTLVSTATGEVNLAASTPGSYAIINTIAATAGCASVADTVFVDINPYTFTSAINVSSSDDQLCLGETVDFFASGTTYNTVLERETFNGTFTPWTATNLSTGGDAADSRWRLRQSPYSWNGDNHTSNDATQFYISNSEDQGGGGTTNTNLKSPVLNTIGFTTLELSFWHYYRDNNGSGDDIARVQVSTNNVTWNSLPGGEYNSNQGGRTNFVNAVFNLNAYVGLPSLWVRFQYNATNDEAWAIDNVTISGQSNRYTYDWSSVPIAFNSTQQNPADYQPTISAYYDVEALNVYGCTSNTSPIPVIVNALPEDNAGVDLDICANIPGNIGLASQDGRTYSWSPATGLSSSSIANPTATLAASSLYTLTETITATGCSDTNRVYVNIRPLSVINNMTAALCSGTAFTAAPANGTNGTVLAGTTYVWDAPSGSGFSGGSAQAVAQNNISQTLSATSISAATATYAVTPKVNGCDGAPFNVEVAISPQSNAGTISGAGSVCVDVNSSALSVSGNVGNLQWQSSTNNVSFTNINGETGSSYTASNLSNTAFYRVVATSGVCAAANGSSAQITTLSRPTASLSGSAEICAGNSSSLSIALTGNGPWSGALSNGQSFSASTSPVLVAVTPGASTGYTISTLNDANCAAIGGLTGSGTITVNPLPTASITGSAVVCGGSAGAVTINGPANGEVAYTLNGSSQAATLNGSGTAIINTGNVYQNLTYSLVEVEDGLCENTATGSATITYQEAPDATISGSTQLCSGASTTIAFNGNPNAVVTYNVNGGASQTVTLNGSGNGSINTGNLNASTTYNLVSVAASGCSSSIGTSAVVNVGLTIYYQDNDGDGYGNSFVSTVACTQPAGYANVGGDCCDSNANINPVCEWWGDMDGDGYGSFIYEVGCIAGVTCSQASWPAGLIPYCPLAHNGVLYTVDCNDNSISVYPGATEICNNTIDDDCDGQLGEGCSGQMFDQWTTAQLINGSNYYPQCVTSGGTLVNTDISPQGNPANVAVGGGRDVWYRFVAPTTGARIQVTPTGFDAVIELQTSTAVQIDAENANAAVGGLEVLNTGNLVAGQTYYVGVRNYNNTNVGTYTICVSPLGVSGCASQAPAGGFSLCNSYKAKWTGASSYTFNFTGVGGNAPLATSSVASLTGTITLNNTNLGLRYASLYNVRVDANYMLNNGLGQPDPMITVLGVVPSVGCQNVAIMQQPLVEVRSTQVCPTLLLRTTSLLANPITGSSNVCGVISYSYEFTRVSNCLGTTVIGSPFVVNTTGATASLTLTSAFPAQLGTTGYWSVRVRPNFIGGLNGTWGPAKVIAVSGSAASQMLDEENATQQVKTFEAQPLSVVYPNPNNGSAVNINLTDIGSGDLTVKIVDAVGRTIYNNRYTVDGALFTQIDFAEQLTGGIYLVEFTINGETMNERMIVER